MTGRPVYGRRHRERRAAAARLVATGTVRCARGSACKHAEQVHEIWAGGLIDPDEPWDLSHDDRDPHRYIGPEHAACNRATTGRGGTRRRPDEPHPGLL